MHYTVKVEVTLNVEADTTQGARCLASDLVTEAVGSYPRIAESDQEVVSCVAPPLHGSAPYLKVSGRTPSLSYLILNAPDETGATHIERVSAGDIVAAIDRLSGREGLGTYIVSGPLHRAGSAYVAVRSDSPWRAIHGSRGFHVRKLTV